MYKAQRSNNLGIFHLDVEGCGGVCLVKEKEGEPPGKRRHRSCNILGACLSPRTSFPPWLIFFLLIGLISFHSEEKQCWIQGSIKRNLPKYVSLLIKFLPSFNYFSASSSDPMLLHIINVPQLILQILNYLVYKVFSPINAINYWRDTLFLISCY